MPPDQFELQYADEIGETLTVLERSRGAFELLAHGSLPEQTGAAPALYAVVRSGDSGSTYLLVRAGAASGRTPRWHEVSAADLPHFRLARPHAA
jgi:hypothetical protein